MVSLDGFCTSRLARASVSPLVRAPDLGQRDTAAPFTRTDVHVSPTVTVQCHACPPRLRCTTTSVPGSGRAGPPVLVTVQCHLLSPRGSCGPRRGHPCSWCGVPGRAVPRGSTPGIGGRKRWPEPPPRTKPHAHTNSTRLCPLQGHHHTMSSSCRCSPGHKIPEILI